MVVFILYCKADLENVATLRLKKEESGLHLSFSVRNPLDPAETRERIVVETHELHSSAVATNEKHRDESPYHFAMKWRDAIRRSTVRVLGVTSELIEDDKNEHDKKVKSKKDSMTHELTKALATCQDAIRGEEDHGRWVPLLALDCDGLEPYAFHPLGEEFAVVGTNGQTYETVDLSDGDWAEYDVSTGSVSVTNFKSEFK